MTIAFLALVAEMGEASGGSDAAAAGWYDVADLLADPQELAFDHAEILADALDRARTAGG